MALIVLTSAKGSPGASTAGLAFVMTWKSPAILAECDPAGGDILSGYLGSLSISADHGLLQLALADTRGNLPQEFFNQLVDLDSPRRQRLVLPGIAGAGQAATLRAAWPRLAAFFAGLEHSTPAYDVIADCGRLATSHPPWPVYQRADLILLALRPASLRTVAPAWPALGELRRELVEAGADPDVIALLLVGAGDYARRELERRLQAPVVAQLPHDPRTAAALGGKGHLKGSRELLRHAASAEAGIREAIAKRRVRQQAGSAGAKESRHA